MRVIGPLTVSNGYVDLNKGEIRNAAFQNLAADPSTPATGQFYFHTGTSKTRVYNGSTWDVFGTGTGDLSSNTSTSTDSELPLFSGTGGKTVKRSNTILAGPGILKVSAGVPSIAVAGDFPTLNQNTTGTAANVTGTVAIANGGTGVATLPTGLLKGAGTGAITAATAGTDYLAPNGSGAALTGITESQITNLTSDLAALAPLANPALTGVPTAPTATGGTSTTQIATTAFVSSAVSGIVAAADALVFKGAIDCSANPNYPAADAGWVYKVSVAGKIGGASGVTVEAGDTLTCTVDSSAAGTQASVGANWVITQANLDAAAMAGNGLTNSGNVLAVNPGTGVTITADAVTIDTSLVGRWAQGTIGNGAATSFVVTHGFTLANKYRQSWSLYDTTTDEEIFASVKATSTTTTTVDFGSAFTPAAAQIAWFASFGA